MALGAEVVDLVRLYVAQHVHQRRAVSEVAVVQEESPCLGSCGSW